MIDIEPELKALKEAYTNHTVAQANLSAMREAAEVAAKARHEAQAALDARIEEIFKDL